MKIKITLTLLIFSLVFALAADAQEGKKVFSKELPELAIQINQAGEHDFDVSVKALKAAKDAAVAAEVQFVPNPSRLVIDLKGATIGKNQTFPVSNSVVKSVRLGVHPNQIRIVVDINSDHVANSSPTKTDSNSYMVNFTVAGDSKTAKPVETPVIEKKVAPTPVEQPTVEQPTIEPPNVTEHIRIHTAPSVTPTEVATSAPTALPTTAATSAAPSATATSAATNTKAPQATATVAKEPTAALSKTPTATRTPKDTAPPTATATATLTKTPKPTRTPKPEPTETPTATPSATATLDEAKSKNAPLSSLLEKHKTDEVGPEVPIGPVNGTQFLVDLRFDYQIQNHEPLLRLVMMNGANFNLIKKDSQTYELVIPKAGIKTKNLAQPHFPPHDFIGFALVHPKYDKETLTVEIKVDRGARITAFARGNEIWIRSSAK